MEKQTDRKAVQRETLTLQEFAEALGVSYHTAYRWQTLGKIRSIPGLRKFLIPRTEVERVLGTAK